MRRSRLRWWGQTWSTACTIAYVPMEVSRGFIGREGCGLGVRHAVQLGELTTALWDEEQYGRRGCARDVLVAQTTDTFLCVCLGASTVQT